MNKACAYQGFFILELLIYSSVVTLIVFSMMYHVFQGSQHLKKVTTISHQTMQWYTAQKQIIQDIVSASCDHNAWINETKQLIFKKSDDISIAWYEENGNLYRKEGNYDFYAKKWKKAMKNLAAQNIKKFSWEFKRNNATIQTIIIKLIGIQQNEERHIKIVAVPTISKILA